MWKNAGKSANQTLARGLSALSQAEQPMKVWFARFSDWVAVCTGSPWAFLIALGVVVAWFIYGLIVGFTDYVQLIINTGTTVVTFLMVFLIQNTQNRDQRALQLKLDELIRVHDAAHNELIGIEKQHVEEHHDED